MNSSIIRYILGYVLKIEAILMLLPCLVAVIYQEKEGFYYLAVAFICGLSGLLMAYRKPKSFVFYLKAGKSLPLPMRCLRLYPVLPQPAQAF